MITRPGTRGLLMCINTTEQSSVYFASYNITPHIDHVCIARYLCDMYDSKGKHARLQLFINFYSLVVLLL